MTKGKTPAKSSDPPKRGRGRPPSPTAKRETFQFRVPEERQAPWNEMAEALKQDKSEWARSGLDAWLRVCARAAELGTNPQELLTEALEDHAKVRAAVAELSNARSLSTLEARLFRVLAPAEWARRNSRD